MMQQLKLKTGGLYTVHPHTILCQFPAPRIVLSTSLYNGGFQKATAIFNHRLHFFVNKESDLPGGSLPGYLALTAQEYGLTPSQATGLLTSARMSCHAYSTHSYNDITVEIIATAGVEQNAARAGDAACYYEHAGNYHPLAGTINLLAFTNASLPQGAMAKALITITEAKTAALQELAITSPITLQPATGTGTDGIILACGQSDAMLCTDTGIQSKLGELFSVSVKEAVKKSLALECHFDAISQGSAAKRAARLGILPEELFTAEPTSQHALLLALTQSVWQEYQWNLLTQEETYLFLDLLHTPSLQPAGAKLACWLQQKIDQ